MLLVVAVGFATAYFLKSCDQNTSSSDTTTPSHNCELKVNLQCPLNQKYKDLTSQLKEDFRYSYIKFQGKRNILLNLYGNESSVYDELSHQEMKEVFEGDMKIGEGLKEEPSYVERKFAPNNKTVSETLKEISKKITPTKPFILADEIGSGKTTTIKMLAIEMKSAYPNHFVSYIDGKNLKIENINSTNTKSTMLSIMNLEPKVVKFVSELYDRKQVIFIWDNPEVLLQKLKLNLNLYKSLKDFGILQIFTTYDEHASYIKSNFNESTVIYKFESTDTDFYTSYFNKKMKDHIENTQQVINRIEEFLKNEVVTDDYNYMSKNSPLFMDMMIPSALKTNYMDIFGSFYNIYENFMKNEGETFNYNLNNQIEILNSIVNDEKLNFESLNNEKAQNELFNAIKDLNYKNLVIIQPSQEKFIMLQYIYESLNNAENLSHSQVKISLNLLIYFSNFHDDKLMRNFIAEMKKNHFKPIVKNVFSTDYKNILLKFSANQNPTIFYTFFEHDPEILALIGSPQKWLEEKFNITLKEELLSEDNSNVWDLYKENLQKGKIFFQIWQYQKFSSVNAIRKFTKMIESTEFFIDLISQTDFNHFYDLVIKNEITPDELLELLLCYHVEINEYIRNRDEIINKLCEKLENEAFEKSTQEIYKLYDIKVECDMKKKRKRRKNI